MTHSRNSMPAVFRMTSPRSAVFHIGMVILMLICIVFFIVFATIHILDLLRNSFSTAISIFCPSRFGISELRLRGNCSADTLYMLHSAFSSCSKQNKTPKIWKFHPRKLLGDRSIAAGIIISVIMVGGMVLEIAGEKEKT